MKVVAAWLVIVYKPIGLTRDPIGPHFILCYI